MFNKRKRESMSFTDLCLALEKKPDTVYVGPECVATYSTSFAKVIVIPGDFTKESDKQIKDRLVRAAMIMTAQNN